MALQLEQDYTQKLSYLKQHYEAELLRLRRQVREREVTITENREQVLVRTQEHELELDRVKLKLEDAENARAEIADHYEKLHRETEALRVQLGKMGFEEEKLRKQVGHLQKQEEKMMQASMRVIGQGDRTSTMTTFFGYWRDWVFAEKQKSVWAVTPKAPGPDGFLYNADISGAVSGASAASARRERDERGGKGTSVGGGGGSYPPPAGGGYYDPNFQQGGKMLGGYNMMNMPGMKGKQGGFPSGGAMGGPRGGFSTASSRFGGGDGGAMGVDHSPVSLGVGDPRFGPSVAYPPGGSTTYYGAGSAGSQRGGPPPRPTGHGGRSFADEYPSTSDEFLRTDPANQLIANYRRDPSYHGAGQGMAQPPDNGMFQPQQNGVGQRPGAPGQNWAEGDAGLSRATGVGVNLRGNEQHFHGPGGGFDSDLEALDGGRNEIIRRQRVEAKRREQELVQLQAQRKSEQMASMVDRRNALEKTRSERVKKLLHGL